MFKFIKPLISKKGQSFVEVIIAVGIISLVVSSILGLVILNLNSMNVSKDEIQAVNLAQEGIEAVRNVRDTNWLDKVNWDTGIDTSKKGIVFNATTNRWELSASEDYFDTNLQRTAAGSQKFTRSITVTDNPLGNPSVDNKKVTVTVAWSDKKVDLIDYLTDWRNANDVPLPSSPTVDIKANSSDGPITISYNSSATLSWTSSDATSCTASDGWSGSKGTSGSESTGNLTSSKTYTLSCTGPGGSASDSVTVNVSLWIDGLAGTPMQGKQVYYQDSGGQQWKISETDCRSPQCATGLDPNYPSSYSLVADNNVDFSSYPARNTCKSIGGRLPNMQELLAIYAARGSYGNNFQSSVYWSATEYNSFWAWAVFFFNADAGYYSKSGNYNYVRCVR